jgi:manganese/zinc/iron transport system permease protein
MDTVFGMDAIVFWIIATMALVNVTGALLGTFLVLRRMSLLGDAISHAVLPGLALAFMLTGTREPFPMLAGAMAAGLLTALLTHLIHRYANVPEDAAMGVVMITRVASHVDLDPGCVLYGVLESAALDTRTVFGMEIPRVAVTLSVTFLVTVSFVALFWKELKIVSFDPQLATTLGINADRVHYLLMGLVAAFTVAAFEAVGSILVVAMLIAPAATAFLLTDRLHWMTLIAAATGILIAILGRNIAAVYDAPVAGMASVVAGGLFMLAVLFAPRYGIVARRLAQVRLGLRISGEDLLGLAYRWQESGARTPLTASGALDAAGGGVASRTALWLLRRAGLLVKSGDGLRLTASGEERASRLVHRHRLWEAYLAKHLPLPDDHLHSPADRMEHFMDSDLQRQVEEQVPEPHGPSGAPR